MPPSSPPLLPSFQCSEGGTQDFLHVNTELHVNLLHVITELSLCSSPLLGCLQPGDVVLLQGYLPHVPTMSQVCTDTFVSPHPRCVWECHVVPSPTLQSCNVLHTDLACTRPCVQCFALLRGGHPVIISLFFNHAEPNILLLK